MTTFDSQEYRGLGPALGPEAEAQRLDLFLAKKFPFNSRSEWKAICERGELRVNGRIAKATYKLRMGDKLAVYHPIENEPEVDTNIHLIKEDSGVIAVFKPGNLPMHESGYFRRNTFGALLAEKFGPEWHPVHRIDRETSGVLVCAASPDVRRELSQDFETRRVDKRYVAVMRGVTDWDEMLVDQPLAEEMNERVPRYLVSADGAPSRTEFKVVQRGEDTTVVEVKPLTGRTSQIRAHAAWLGHPLVGDKVYHPDPRVYDAYHRLGDTEEVRVLAGFPRHALHAAWIALRHPVTGKVFEAAAAMPADMTALLREEAFAPRQVSQ